MTDTNKNTTYIYIKTHWGGYSSFSDSQLDALISDLTAKAGALGGCDDDKGFTVEVPSHKVSHAIDIARCHGFDDAQVED